MDTLVSVIKKYDLVAIQEVKNKSGEAYQILMTHLNQNGDYYGSIISERTGKNEDDLKSQEQYLYVYDKRKIIAWQEVKIGEELYEPKVISDEEDDYQREPFLAFFSAVDSSFMFSVFSIHTKPKEAYSEIEALLNVGNDFNEKFISCSSGYCDFMKNVILLGDFNADCSYLSDKEEVYLKEKYDSLKWIIPDDTDTNLAKSDCAYDRIVLSHNLMNYFKGDYGVDRSFSSKVVSDHYPVWFKVVY
jgi:endonuclease/exonuclease/phosphatase family metal-dependent hydrolase